jgi:hypothetical protein
MTKTRKSSTRVIHSAIEAVEALATSQGQVIGPVRAGSYLADFPSHITLDGVNTRVTASSSRTRAQGRKVHVFETRHFRDVPWQILACMPEGLADDPILFKLPSAVLCGRRRIVIDLENLGLFGPYRWSPETRQERRHQVWLDRHVWDGC